MYFHPTNERKFLSSFNPVIVIGVFYTAILFRTGMGPSVPKLILFWDILLPFVAYFGQRRSLAEGLTLTILCTHLYSLTSSAPVGIFIIEYIGLFLLARAISYIVYPERVGSIIGLMLVLYLISRFLLVLISKSFGIHEIAVFGGLSLFLKLLVNGFLGYLVYRFIGILDRITAKAPMNRIQIAVGDL